jgi:S-methylmethionine-dependent homocysteine/selenocysteine methylase
MVGECVTDRRIPRKLLCAGEYFSSNIGIGSLVIGQFGGYANTFEPVPADWELDGDKHSEWSLHRRSDLNPGAYAVHAEGWLKLGATIIGGCPGTRPAHIANLFQLIHQA